MLITSRSYDEYRAMFDLGALPSSVLDCCAGGASFTAVAASAGARAVAADPAYRLSPGELADAVRGGTTGGAGIVDRFPGDFVWTWYGDRARRDAMRAQAADRFLADLPSGRYVAATLPELPFADGAFELVLCSHLLFTWADQLDAGWHLAALRELARVSRGEVRVFPLVVQGNGAPVPFLTDVRQALEADGRPSEIRQVPYEFQRGADRMLVVGPA